jgi:glycosyltransferase involved in cell wall biosynthesis
MPDLTVSYTDNATLGYGRMGIKVVEAVAAKGVTIHPERSKTNVAAWFAFPSHAHGWWEGQRTVAMTMWEATRLPEGFRSLFHEFDVICVPSEQNVDLFAQYHDNVRLVYLGIDPEDWHFVARRPPKREFVFLCGGSGARKGTDLAFRAFVDLFGRGDFDPQPRLILKSPKGVEHTHERVETITGKLSARDEIALYRRSHCYLQPSRGEGFGMQPLQAIAQGLPTILTDAHGHKAFAKLGWPVQADLVPAGKFIFGEAGEWWEPDYDELCEQMLDVYSDYPGACTAARLAAASVATTFTWAHTADAFMDAIGRDELDKPYSGSGEWHTPCERLFRARTTKDLLGPERAVHVNDRTFEFRKGEDQMVPADVKRMLYDAGYLDPECVDEKRILALA